MFIGIKLAHFPKDNDFQLKDNTKERKNKETTNAEEEGKTLDWLPEGGIVTVGFAEEETKTTE